MDFKDSIVYKHKYLPIITAFILMIMTLSISYAFFIYNSYGSKDVAVESGKVFMNLNELSQSATLTNLYPMTDVEGINQTTSFNFSVSGYATGSNVIYYDVIAINGNAIDGKTRFGDNDISLYLTDDQGFVLYGPGLATGLSSNGANLVQASIKGGDENNLVTHSYVLKMWVNDSVVISKTETSISGKTIYTPEQIKNEYFSIKIRIKGPSTMADSEGIISAKVRYDLASNLYTPSGDTDQTFIVGTANDNNYNPNNYIWYSGKLWRIVALNKTNGIITSIKVISDIPLTSISFNGSGTGSYTTYYNSYAYQWLTEDFYDTLRNPSNFIITNYNWNVTLASTTTKPANTTIVTSPVGLLNIYEYGTSYTNTTVGNGYLNNGYYWWTITQKDNYNVNSIYNTGVITPTSYSGRYGIRPCLNLKANLKITSGAGTAANPYRLYGDNDQESSLIDNYLNTRYSGEFLTFNNDLYRIVKVENGLTKIIKVYYLKQSSTSVTKPFGTTILYSQSLLDGTNYWGGYLNNNTASGWYGSLSVDNQNMINDGTWYLGPVYAAESYKLSICSTVSAIASGQTLTSNCTKTSTTATSKIGLIRLGEMFSSPTVKSSEALSDLTVTPYGTSYITFISYYGINSTANLSTNYAARPTFYLKSSVYITGGDGTSSNPFTIGN